MREGLLSDEISEDKLATYWGAMYQPADGRPAFRATQMEPGEEGVLAEVRFVERLYGIPLIAESVEDFAADRVSWNRGGRKEAQEVIKSVTAVVNPIVQTQTQPPAPAVVVRKHRILSRIPLVGRFAH